MTRSDLKKAIVELLGKQTSLRARDIAHLLGVEKTSVNSILYSELRGKVIQDTQYRWSLAKPRESSNFPPPRKSQDAVSDPQLSKISKYYLECLEHDDQGGMSVFASSKFNDPDYAELSSFPIDTAADSNPFLSEVARRIVGRARKDRGRLTTMVGYPVNLVKVRSKKGWEGFLLQPVMLFSIDEGDIARSEAVSMSEAAPQLNFKAIRSLSEGEESNTIEEIVLLSEELGLANAPNDVPEVDELVLRLAEIRPGWNWVEKMQPEHLGCDPRLSEAQTPGIYNRAILFLAERSPFTKGLETELAQLQNLSKARYAESALASWVDRSFVDRDLPAPEPLIEIIPLNSEQRQAVHQGLHNQLTVITGPPGTGKSQVVASLLVNAIWQGKTVLFASKNNKAVDVVEARVNALGPRPVLLRLGSSEYQANLAEYLLALLSIASTEDDKKHYEEAHNASKTLHAKFRQTEEELASIVTARNKVDHMEQAVESLRKKLGSELFKRSKDIDIADCESMICEINDCLAGAIKGKQPFFHQMLWPFLKGARFQRLHDGVLLNQTMLKSLEIPMPVVPPTDISIHHWSRFADTIQERISEVKRVNEYYQALHTLSASISIEKMSQELYDLVEELSETSKQLWESWLRLQPDRLGAADRQLIQEYSSLLKLVIGQRASGESMDQSVYSRYQNLFYKIRHLLTGWAVTSLSARGRVPFESASFDLLIVDEASQCDIASALPLLFRAKRAVIIGDPKQLRHISGLSPKQDGTILAKHGLIETHASWSYSVNSLFDLAAGLTKSEDVVQLRDHHRSHADIIEFSNRQFYEGRLRVATNYDRLHRVSNQESAVRWISVQGKVVTPTSGGAVNDQEAKGVIRELQRLVLEQRYAGSIGVVSPFRAQANRIRDLVNQDENLITALARNDFLVDTVHRFQGDERDLILFSPVVSTGISHGAIGFLQGTPNLFNVAITRARSMLLIVGDQRAAVDCGVDYLSKFAKYVSEMASVPKKTERQQEALGPHYPTVTRPEIVSDWERVLYTSLFGAGFRPIPQYDEDKYTLDFALFLDNRKLNIEVDGERYHRDWSGELCRRDVIRNQRLMELGWDVMRFWVYQVRDDMDGCIDRVRHWADGSEN